MLKTTEPTITSNIKVDRLTICMTVSEESTAQSVSSLLSDNITKEPGVSTKPGGLYKVRATITLPQQLPNLKPAKILIEAGPKVGKRPSFRLDFNPANLHGEAWTYLYGFMQSHFDPSPEAFFKKGKCTRIDLAVDHVGLRLEDVIVRTTGKKKIGVYSDQFGRPQTAYLGAPTGKNRLVAYDKHDKATDQTNLRIECRVNPGLIGKNLHTLKNPFAQVELYPVSAISEAMLGFSPTIFADSARVRGVSRAVKLLSPKRQALVELKLQGSSALMLDYEALWEDFPLALNQSGFFDGLPS